MRVYNVAEQDPDTELPIKRRKYIIYICTNVLVPLLEQLVGTYEDAAKIMTTPCAHRTCSVARHGYMLQTSA